MTSLKKLKRELIVFFMSTVYIWVYYLLAVLGNKEHPMDAYAAVMIVGSFFGLPILMFIIVPIINGIIVGKFLKVKMALRIIIYVIISSFLLHGVFSVHMAISNHLVKQRLFPDGIEVVALKQFNEIKETAKGEINLLSYEYDAPFHSDINAGNMSGTTKPSIDIRYEFADCSSNDCERTHSIEYDMKTGKPIEPVLPIVGIPNIEWGDAFVGEYIGLENELRYTIFMIDHASDGHKLNFRRYDPYFNFDIVLEHSEPFYTKGTIKDATVKNTKGDYETDSSLAGKTVEFIQKDNKVEVWVGGVFHTMLIPFKR